MFGDHEKLYPENYVFIYYIKPGFFFANAPETALQSMAAMYLTKLMKQNFDFILHTRGLLNTVSKAQETKIMQMFPIDITSTEWSKIEKLSLPKDVITDIW